MSKASQTEKLLKQQLDVSLRIESLLGKSEKKEEKMTEREEAIINEAMDGLEIMKGNTND